EEVIHRVKILNLPPHEMGSVKKLLQRLDLHQRYKKAPKWDYAYLNFERLLTTEYIKVDQKAFRARFEAKSKAQEAKAVAEMDTRLPAERLADQVTPLYKIPYADQVAKKHKLGHRFMNTLRKKLNTLPELSEAGKGQIAWTNRWEDADYRVEDIIQSPIVNGYRTKCEFTIGKNLAGEKTVGFLLGLYREGYTAVLETEQCLHVSDTAKQITKAMEDYVRQSKYDVYDRVEKTGVWRSMMTKTQRTGDNMILIQMKADELSSDQIEQEKQSLIAYWNSLKEEGKINTTTLLLQIWNGDSNCITDKGKTEILIGDGYVHEEILGCKFRISSSAFFQVNTPATELLYAKCAEWCNFKQEKKTTLLDLCCGTGTIGIIMAKSVDRVIGIEVVPEAIVDAQANASINGVDNIQYHTGKVEEKIDVITKEENEQVLAILDPPRIIFISCDAKQAMQNFIGLCRPTSNRFKGLPFKPSRAVSIDLFPHTDHSELMIEFVRIEQEGSEE
ncbi:S-adenosyl-L-methionine-dependent methyltransferase, partial [Blakeslea trispora]